MSAAHPGGPVAEHWDAAYRTRTADEVSWFQAEPATSLELISRADADPDAPIVDVGGGASTLVDRLLDAGRCDVTVLDVSGEALAVSRARLGDRAGAVSWVVADLLDWTPPRRYDVWHDRAVFHFLTDPADRRRYRDALCSALAPGGVAVLATFAPDGPQQCSGLRTARYGPDELIEELGPGWEREDARREEHVTPAGVVQPFTWVVARRVGG